MQLKHLSALILFIAIFIAGCQSNTDPGKVKEELMQADRDFSNLSIEKGMNAAFLEYIADDGVLLRPNQMPVVGKDNARELLNRPDSAFSISWEPLFADASASGELGYTYGTYKVEAKAEDGSPVVSEGTYVSIWKKDGLGRWRFVMDSGNQGLGNQVGEVK